MNKLVKVNLIAVTLLASCATIANAQTTDIGALTARVGVLPRLNQWTLIEPDSRPALKDVAKLSNEQRDALARSDSPVDRSIAIFIADQQGDVAALLSYARMLDDQRPGLPYAARVAGVDQYDRSDQSVAEYLTSAYLDWFGVDVDSSIKRFERYFAEVDESDNLVKPWIVRLRRAKHDAGKTADLKQHITTLPADVRWAVVTLGYKESVYTSKQARKLLSQLPPATRRAVDIRDNILPDEPLFKINRGSMRRLLLDESRSLLAISEKP